MTYSTAQLVALAITPKITSTISIPCSLFILREVRRDHIRGRGKAIDRVIAGMNTVDILASLGWFFSTWLVPKGSPNTIFSAGNTQTCVLQGFLLQIAIGAPLYNCSLSIFYLLTVRYRWSDDRLRKIELWVHSSVVAFALGTGLLGIPLKLYNHIGTVCWVIESPQGCSQSDVPCERGDHAALYGIALFYGPLWVCVILTIVAMVLIYVQVRNTARRTESHSFIPRRNSLMMTFQDTLRRKTNIPTDEVALQAFLYGLSFFVTWTPSTIWSVAHWFGFSAFWLELLSSICEPLQGFWNFFVFLRPRKTLRIRLSDTCERFFCYCCRRIRKSGTTTAAGNGYPECSETGIMNAESILAELGTISKEASLPPLPPISDDSEFSSSSTNSEIMDADMKKEENGTGSMEQTLELNVLHASTDSNGNGHTSLNPAAANDDASNEEDIDVYDDVFLDDNPIPSSVEEKREIEAIP